MVSVNLSGRNLITLRDYSAEKLRTTMKLRTTIYETAIDLKLKLVHGESHNLLQGKTLAIVFVRVLKSDPYLATT